MPITGTQSSASDGRICQVDDVKDRLGIATSDTDYDSVLAQIIGGVEGLFNSYCRRDLIVNSSDVTEYYGGPGPMIQVRRYPIVSVTSLKYSLTRNWSGVAALTENTDYLLLAGGENGIIHRIYGSWHDSPDTVQVIYRGGYAAAGQTPGDGETALPTDIREAAIQQATLIYKRRDDVGLSGVGFEGGSFDKFSGFELTKAVKELLNPYRRIVV